MLGRGLHGGKLTICTWHTFQNTSQGGPGLLLAGHVQLRFQANSKPKPLVNFEPSCAGAAKDAGNKAEDNARDAGKKTENATKDAGKKTENAAKDAGNKAKDIGNKTQSAAEDAADDPKGAAQEAGDQTKDGRQ